MKNIISIDKNYSIKQIESLGLTFEEFGFLTSINETGTLFDFKTLEKEFYATEKEIILILKKLAKNKKIEIIIFSNSDNVNWQLKYNIAENKKTSKNKNTLTFLFGITSVQELQLGKELNGNLLFKKLLNIVDLSFENLQINDDIIIGNEKTYVVYLKSFSPIIILKNLNIKITNDNLEFIFNKCHVEKREIALVNFLIEYSVKNSKYNNFSTKFAELMLESWDAQKIKTVEKCISFFKEIKNSEVKGKYVEPVWDKKESSEVEKNTTKIDDLLSKNGLV